MQLSMITKINSGLIFPLMILVSCTGRMKEDTRKQAPNQMEGTWKLITGMVIEKGDTTITDYTKNISFIKIINDTHFAFLQHDLDKGKDSAAVFVAGGGRYSLHDSLYTENLEYCSARNWEGNDFSFVINIKNDTLTQTGVEKLASAGVNRVNIEKYVKLEE